MPKGLIHVYTGEGKGKTTAAIGLAMRAAGHGKKVLILQFLKGGKRDSGEIAKAKSLNIKAIRFKDQVSPIFNPEVKIEELRESVKRAITLSIKEIKSNPYDMVIMDEFNNLLQSGLTTMDDVHKIIKEKPSHTELVFTGRGAPKELIKIADYATQMRMLKHPFSRGVKARKGIEF